MWLAGNAGGKGGAKAGWKGGARTAQPPRPCLPTCQRRRCPRWQRTPPGAWRSCRGCRAHEFDQPLVSEAGGRPTAPSPPPLWPRPRAHRPWGGRHDAAQRCAAGAGRRACLLIHLMAQSAFRLTQGTVWVAWNRRSRSVGSLTYDSSSKLYISARMQAWASVSAWCDRRPGGGGAGGAVGATNFGRECGATTRTRVDVLNGYLEAVERARLRVKGRE
jgi:hypothetical protein